MSLREIEWSGMSVDLGQDRDQWRAHGNTVMKLRLHKILGNACAAARLAASPGGLTVSSMELVSFMFVSHFR
jgi:hypothetical protein